MPNPIRFLIAFAAAVLLGVIVYALAPQLNASRPAQTVVFAAIFCTIGALAPWRDE